MTDTRNDRLLRALRREPVDRTPIWIMRQAGRYLPEYRATRSRAGSFLALCKNPELACEVTLQPLDRFALDAAILFSDILTVPDAMGLGLGFHDGEGPRFERPVTRPADVAALGVPDPERELGYVMDAVRLIRRELAGRVPLIGFSGSPWTLACYMVEGGGSERHARVKAMALDDPATMHRLLELLARAVTSYLQAQIAAGAEAVMVFDTWGGALPAAGYREFSLRYMAQVAAGLDRGSGAARVPLILFSKGVQQLEAMADAGCDALGLDWTIDIGEARRRVGQRVALQGNLDPVTLLAGREALRRAVAEVLAGFGHGSGHVFNLGHGVTPDVDPDSVRELVDAVHELSAPYHR